MKHGLHAPAAAHHAGDANEILRPTLGPHSMLVLDGDEHMRQRKLLLPAFHGERIERYREIMREAPSARSQRWPAGEPFACARTRRRSRSR